MDSGPEMIGQGTHLLLQAISTYYTSIHSSIYAMHNHRSWVLMAS